MLINARVAGCIYLVILIVGVGSEVSLRSRLIVPANAAATAENLRDSGWLLRAVVAASIVYLVAEVILTVILYLLFRPVSAELSLAAAAVRLVSLAIFALNLLHLFAALVIVTDADYLSDLGPGREALALLFLDLYRYGYAIGLIFFALNCFFMGALLIRSGHVRTALGVLLGVAGLGYLINSFLFLLVPGYTGGVQPLLLAPAFVAEAWFCAVLLRRGGSVRDWDEPTLVSGAAAPGGAR